jgi:hypothetical protein
MKDLAQATIGFQKMPLRLLGGDFYEQASGAQSSWAPAGTQQTKLNKSRVSMTSSAYLFLLSSQRSRSISLTRD